jgi:hypothetical protein
VQIRDGALVVAAAPAVQERIAKDLKEVRDAFSKFVRIDLRVATMARPPGVASVPDGELEAFLKERQAETAIAPSIVCRNGDSASIETVREVSYVRDFGVVLDGSGRAVADPEVATVREGVTARLRPFVVGESVRVVCSVDVTEVLRPLRTVKLPLPLALPLEVQVPETTTASATRLVECAPGAWTVVDLGSHVILLRAAPQ